MKLLQPFVPVDLAAPPSSRQGPVVDETPDEEMAKKERFAELLLKEDDPFKVGLIVYPDNTPRALWVANHWPNDPDVIAIRKSLVDSEGELSFLPTEADASKLAWNIARNETVDVEQRLRALELYGKLRGHIKRPDVVVQTNTQTNIIQSNVMVVRDFGGVDQWEKRAIAQQKELKAEVIKDVSRS